MKANDLRQSFLKFFEMHHHRIIPSSSLIPDNDPSVLFTTAGMQQFKFYYSGIKNPLTDIHPLINEPLNTYNVTTCQKCIRTSDIESVGDERHLTFFEMLGNFSFGGYFKKEAINLAYEFLTQNLQISLARMKVTVFKGDNEVPQDKESIKIWNQLGFSEEKGNLQLLTRENNFWGPTGNEGPCGPTTEIYVDGIEIWNIVFNEYFMFQDKHLEPLKIKGVDTGMGLERLALVMQFPEEAFPLKNKTIFDTDLFSDLMLSLKENSFIQDFQKQRIIADHYRASVFIAGSGIIPSNTERGYILRRLIRRIVRYAKLINLKEDWYQKGYKIIKEKYGSFYPEINNPEILDVILNEKNKFEKTLEEGLKKWQTIVDNLKGNTISGKDAFYLYESYGFPIEILEEIAREQNKKVDKITFKEEFKKHQELSRQSQERKFGGHGINNITDPQEKERITKLHTATHLLLAALKQILNTNIEQHGSDITTERLRLDFNFPRKLTNEEIQQIENLVNEKIKEGLIVTHYETTFTDAIKNGAAKTLKDHYPDKVIVYEIKNPVTNKIFSKEICAGPHVNNTKELNHFKILKEESSGQGIRRIKATIE
ncbi:MAG: alanine--tRNA ligase [Minisyncoccia bacterium]